ncbi:Cyclic AMP receptor-like protein A like [Verticillium longisporum]|uniref:Cyclic AMP receptor-like protein A like n=1 Tax=Verticillium longisporum TaxID=100787 RepID=A0A8I3AW00_VERLO|nr:Cyclic AMP receptor-like protein A like [Verticillium longisporum]
MLSAHTFCSSSLVRVTASSLGFPCTDALLGIFSLALVSPSPSRRQLSIVCPTWDCLYNVSPLVQTTSPPVVSGPEDPILSLKPILSRLAFQLPQRLRVPQKPLLTLTLLGRAARAPPTLLVGHPSSLPSDQLVPRQYSGPEKMPLSGTQVTTIIALERTGASLSLIGITLIFVSYYLFKRLRTIPNLFIVFASVANIGASIACLIGYDGILIGEASALCQAQAFMLEMFMQSDPWWSLAMAVNVYLVFFFGASPASFRQYLWVYCVICFGGPFIPAIVLLLARPNGQMMYGNATLWCWINSDWSELRIYTYYLPIWICILCSILIYFAVGYHVFHQRNQLRNLTFSHIKDANEVSMSEDNRDSAEKNLTGRSEDWQVTAVTEVQITTGSPRPDRTIEIPTVPPAALTDSPQIHSAGHAQSWHSSHERVPSPVISHTRFETMISSNPPPPPPRRSLLGYVKGGMQKFNAKLQGLDPVKLAYLRTSFIFAISILVTWTPSSINRVNDLVNPGQVSFGLNVATAIVLPLQGVWNAVIYFMTSWTTVKEEYHRLMHRRSVRRLDSRDDSRGRSARLNVFRGHRDNHFDPSHLERGKRPRSGQVSEYELAPPAKRGHGNVRAMRGSF